MQLIQTTGSRLQRSERKSVVAKRPENAAARLLPVLLLLTLLLEPRLGALELHSLRLEAHDTAAPLLADGGVVVGVLRAHNRDNVAKLLAVLRAHVRQRKAR